MSAATQPPTPASKLQPLRFRPESLLEYASRTLEIVHVPAPDAREVADCLVLADLRGVDSHGLIRLRPYLRRIQAGAVNAKPAIQVTNPFGSVALVDGDNGLGAVVGSRSMHAAMHLAGSSGTGFAGARHSNHFGVGAHYVYKAVRAGFIGFAFSNAPPNMAPFGGRQRFLGTNPFAVGIPAGKRPALIFDASSSVAARGKIISAAQRHVPIPAGWALDPEGRPTTDAREALAGAVLPFGGPKGSAISFIIDILCGALTGAAFALHLNTIENLKAQQNIGHIFAAVRTDLFLPAEEFARRMDEIVDMLAASPPGAGIPRVLLPGELEHQAEATNRESGVPLSQELVDDLTGIGAELGVAFPAPIPFPAEQQAL